MTINELDQAIRTLVISQPMITASPIGSTITNILSVIDNFRNFKLSVQTYPMQDSFKFLTLNECQRLENTLTLSICQVLQEKGLNVMSYMSSSFSPVQPVQNPSIIGQMSFSQPMTPIRPMNQFQPDYTSQINSRQNVQFNRPYDMQNRMMGGMPNSSPLPPQPPIYSRPNQSQFNGMRDSFHQNINAQTQSPQTQPLNPIKTTSNYSPFNPNKQQNQQKYTDNLNQSSAKLSGVEFSNPIQKPTTQKNTKQKTTPTIEVKMNEPEQVEEPTIEQQNEEVPSKKAAGRDYLLQLLKK